VHSACLNNLIVKALEVSATAEIASRQGDSTRLSCLQDDVGLLFIIDLLIKYLTLSSIDIKFFRLHEFIEFIIVFEENYDRSLELLLNCDLIHNL